MERVLASHKTIALRNVFLHVTKACNLRCDYCYFSASKPLPDELTTEELQNLWPALVAVHPQKVVFTGGEPLLREDALELLRGLRAADPGHRVLRCLNTNGHLVTADIAEAMVGVVDEVRVSLDGLAAANDARRGPGNFAAALRALDHLYGVGFEPKVLITVTSTTLPDVERLLCLLVNRGITRININPFRPVGRGKVHHSWSANPTEVQAAVARAWQRCFPDRPVPPKPRERGLRTNCGVGSFLNIMPNGDVFPCHVLTQREFRCGNVREDPLSQICRRAGPLGRLQRLDFHDLARADKAVADLTRPCTCMGDVYAATRALPIWNEWLPLAKTTRR